MSPAELAELGLGADGHPRETRPTGGSIFGLIEEEGPRQAPPKRRARRNDWKLSPLPPEPMIPPTICGQARWPTMRELKHYLCEDDQNSRIRPTVSLARIGFETRLDIDAPGYDPTEAAWAQQDPAD